MSQEGKILLLPAAGQAVLLSHCSVLSAALSLARLTPSEPGLILEGRGWKAERVAPGPTQWNHRSCYYLTEPSLSSRVNRFPGDSGCGAFIVLFQVYR